MPLSAQQIKFIKALSQKKNRQQLKLFVAEGPKVVNDFISRGFPLDTLYATANYISENKGLLNENSVQIIEISEKELTRISTLSTPNKVLALCRIPEYRMEEKYVLSHWSLVLDGINDPGNMGTIIRLAHWFNIGYIFCSPDCVEAYNPKTVQAAMGSLAAVKVVYTDLPSFLQQFAGRMPVLGTYMNGESVYTLNTGSKGLIVMGSEAHGISTAIEPYITQKTGIPAPVVHNHPDSLNVAVSTGIVLSEIFRKGAL